MNIVITRCVGWALCLALAGCASSAMNGTRPVAHNAEELVSDVRVTAGYGGCQSCTNIQTFTTGDIMPRQIYNDHFASGLPNLGFIGITPSLVITNNDGTFTGKSPEDNKAFFAWFSDREKTGDNYLFGHTTKADNSHYPYHLMVRVEHNSSYQDYKAYLIDHGEYIPIPSMLPKGDKRTQMCIGIAGCIWVGDYVLPNTVVTEAIETNTGITMYFGSFGKKAIPSQDGYTQSYVTDYRGKRIVIPPDYLRAFISKVKTMRELE